METLESSLDWLESNPLTAKMENIRVKLENTRG